MRPQKLNFPLIKDKKPTGNPRSPLIQYKQKVLDILKVAHLPLKFKYYRQIEHGEKEVEYRNKNDYWRTRLQDATHIKFRKGYTKETMLFKIRRVIEHHEFYEIFLGERVG